MKTPEDIKRLREISARLEELGIPEKSLKGINEWIDKEEQKLDEFLKTANPIERMGIGKQ